MQTKLPTSYTRYAWLLDLILVFAILFGAWYLRNIGLNWDENQHLHPDERFLTMVTNAISPVQSFSEYFDTAQSSLNPNNRGFGFYVYGTLPIFVVRYIGEWVKQTGYDEVTLLGRQVANIADLIAIFLLYLIALRLYGRRVALLAAAFSAVAVMQIQQSHFYTVDNFPTLFMTLAAYFAVELLMGSSRRESQSWWRRPTLWNTVGFGIATGMAAASKLNAVPVAILLPLALGLRYLREQREAAAEAAKASAEAAVVAEQAVAGVAMAAEPQVEETADVDSEAIEGQESALSMAVDAEGAGAVSELPDADQPEIIPSVLEPVPGVPAPAPAPRQRVLGFDLLALLLVLGAVMTLLTFRICQPYAFSGPGFFNVTPNPTWVSGIEEQRSQASGDVDFPPALQWARRSITYSGYHLTAWGLGWPLGLLAWAGVLLMGWRILRGEWKENLLLWFWTVLYFAWQSTQLNPTMRYQLPIYPFLALMAAWLVFEGVRRQSWKPYVYLLGGLVLAATTFYAVAFVQIYTRPQPRVAATRWIFQNIPGPLNLVVDQNGQLNQQPMPFLSDGMLHPDQPYNNRFTAKYTGPLRSLRFGHVLDFSASGPQTITVTIAAEEGFNTNNILGSATLTADFQQRTSPRGETYEVVFSQPVNLEKDKNYDLRIETSMALSVSGMAMVNESSWDDGLPLRMDGYDPFGGIYQGDLSMEMYWDDNADKFTRFTSMMDTADYLIISSNRQWGTTTRVPERYPLTSAYYRALLGCPPDKEIFWCYSVARPKDFKGKLGFELVEVFESYPGLGPLRFNSQFADEAFSVYDHPKVLIFKKTADYKSEAVREILGQVDLAKVVHLTPYQAARFPSGLMNPRTCFDIPAICNALGAPWAAQITGQGGLSTQASGMQLSPERLAVQKAGGTWSALFSYSAIQNRFPVLGLLLWYGFLMLLGWVMYPLMRFFLPGLIDRGYAFGRFGGLVILGYVPWLFASVGGVYTREVIGLVFGLITLSGLGIAWFQRAEIQEELRTRGRFMVVVELVFLAFFLIDFLIRLGNPDLWHPSKGGERPMDFSYFNAVIKSTTFPPYDPWFSGGSLNYYYYGYVLVGTPVKLLGIVPSIAYNFILPSLFAMLAIGGFSIAWNLLQAVARPAETEDEKPALIGLPFWGGISAALGVALLGNLAVVRMVYEAMQKLAVPEDQFANQSVWFFQRWAWALEGLSKYISGAGLPIGPIGSGSWYWDPSRVMPPGDSAITEFPFFTFLYSDLHAHMIAMPITVLVLGWAISALLARGQKAWQWLISLAFGGLVLGALRPTNTWDLPTYLVFAALTCGYAIFRYVDLGERPPFGLHPVIARLLLAAVGVVALVGFSFVFYQPFAQWFGLGYSQVTRWENEKTPFAAYWTHWGLFLFVLFFWMAWETRQWLDQTPLSALNRFRPYAGQIRNAVLLFVFGLIGATMALSVYFGLKIAWFAFPMAVWALVLMLRPDQPDAKRLTLFMASTALVLTMGVDMFAISGDRMNTVFKFYIQAWILFSISAGAALAWTLSEIEQWNAIWRNAWHAVLAVLLASAALFPLVGGLDKIKDRMSQQVPFTFDTMEFMAHATLWDGQELQLVEDYRAIRWLQDNVQGSPVILEGHTTEYRWGNRFTIYTGLPGVIGWNWHQRQQRALTPDTWVFQRVDGVDQFYNTTDLAFVADFLKKYHVEYILVGQLERSIYMASPAGISKFEEQNGSLWQEVYRDGATAIYQVK